MPLARARVASDRPSKFVNTVLPCCTNLRATPEPMAPAAMTATVVIVMKRRDGDNNVLLEK
ncbi:nad-binding phosphogluconate dehydrogenase-like protein [Moniliophthora roreri]|nr:nad-binding phosphogluconate dehydrogenase-like protein [Moniliophthora roreri]